MAKDSGDTAKFRIPWKINNYALYPEPTGSLVYVSYQETDLTGPTVVSYFNRKSRG